jgi:glycosyltransferase involved in cell wall biosynthesis
VRRSPPGYLIAVDDGRLAEILVGGGGGMLVRDGDSSLMAEAVIQLLADPDLRTQMSVAGRLRFQERFTAATMAADMQAVLESVAGASRPAR